MDDNSIACEIGDFTYYSDFDDPLKFFDRNVLYDFGYLKSKLIIGKYCSLAHGCRFIMPDANHAITSPSTYPFPGPWSDRVPIEDVPLPPKGDTVVGNDVWIGYEAVIMPGVTIGDGAVVGARSVVTRDIPAYHIVAGNPARVVRPRLGQAEIERLRGLAWWDWSPAIVFEAMPVLIGGDVEALERFAHAHRGRAHDGR
jgi:virginiamycin A acetyltransferase